jgi:hypothetical protein
MGWQFINGMPVIEIGAPNSMPKKEIISLAMKNEEIKKYTKGKIITESSYFPGYLLSLVFKRPTKKGTKNNT